MGITVASPYSMRSLLCIPALLFAFTVSANAQYTVKQIVFDGQTPYTQAELEAASGLKPGQAVGNESLQAAAQKLVDSGAFEDLQATLDGPMKAVNVIFKVKPVDPGKLLHISYANFVWWTPEELKAEISRRVPLTGETVPEAGTLQSSVQAALEAMLQEKGMAGAKVDEQVLEPSPGVPYRVAAYRVAQPAIVFGALTVQGASAAMQPSVQKLTSALAGRPYSTTVGGRDIADTLLTVYRDAGYMAAKMSPVERSFTGTGPVQVALTTTVTEGEVYKLGSVSWAGSPWMTQEQFLAGAKLQTGAPVSQKSLNTAMNAIQNVYRQHGYLDVTVNAVPALDEATHTANMKVEVVPGEVYHLEVAKVTGLNAGQQSVWDKDWSMKPGDVFDAGAVTAFLKTHIASPPFEGYSSAFKQTVDPTAKTVVLEVSFTKMRG